MTPELEGNLVDSANSTAPYLESLLLTYEDDVPADHVIAADPELAATGAEVVPGLLAAGTLAMLGTVLTMVAVRRRRRA
jgi:LPXTG-motif cell wall-anchored protein